MDRDDDLREERAGESSGGDYSRGDRPGGPSQPDDGGFAEGAEQGEGTGQAEPDFARGAHSPDDDTEEAEGRFSRGAEAPGTEERSKEGRFSEGIEQLPHDRK